MELYERIRRDRQAGAGIRELSRRYKVHRRTVHEALESAVPRTRKAPVRESPVLGPWKPVIRGWLEADVKEEVPRKQRHTARRVWQRLEEEHGAEVSESAVRVYVAEVKAELANTALDVTIGQEHAPGEDAEVDFGSSAPASTGSCWCCSCSSCACRPRGVGSRWRSSIRRRRRSWRATRSRSLTSVGCRAG